MNLTRFNWNHFMATKEAIDFMDIFKTMNFDKIDSIDFFEGVLSPFDCMDEIVNDFNNQEHVSFPDSIDYQKSREILTQLFNNGFIDYHPDTSHEDYDEKETYYISSPERGLYGFIPLISTLLFNKYPDYFFPYLFTQKFSLLKQIFDCFEITLPSIPKRNDYLERFLYYLDLCESLNQFRTKMEFSPEELCAFLHHYAPNFINELDQLNTLDSDSKLPNPSNIWLIGGDIPKEETFEDYKESDFGFWQCNQNTQKGDLIIFYSRTPVSSFHSIWRAIDNGGVDPFFFYYNYTYISHPIKIPLVTNKELKAHPYFKELGIVRGNFQGVNGVHFSFNDYFELLKLLDDKGFNNSLLPKLINPIFATNSDLKKEKDVEEKLLEPLLEKIGLMSKAKRQLLVKMGTGERNYADYAIDVKGTDRFETASILIEAKYYFKSTHNIERFFEQAHSYALRLSSKIIILCDKEQIFIFPKKSNSFSRNIFDRYYWVELENLDKLNEFKKKLVF